MGIIIFLAGGYTVVAPVMSPWHSPPPAQVVSGDHVGLPEGSYPQGYSVPAQREHWKCWRANVQKTFP